MFSVSRNDLAEQSGEVKAGVNMTNMREWVCGWRAGGSYPDRPEPSAVH